MNILNIGCGVIVVGNIKLYKFFYLFNSLLTKIMKNFSNFLLVLKNFVYLQKKLNVKEQTTEIE